MRLMVAMLLSLLDGLGEHPPSSPDTVALHCSIELKLQFFMKSTSTLQYSPARAVGAANNAPSTIVEANVAVEIVAALSMFLIVCSEFLSD